MILLNFVYFEIWVLDLLSGLEDVGLESVLSHIFLLFDLLKLPYLVHLLLVLLMKFINS